MFTIPTLPKILLIVLVIAAVWWWHRRSQIKNKREQAELERNPRSRAKGKAAKPVEDMAQCKLCGAYVPAIGARNCGRDKCPF